MALALKRNSRLSTAIAASAILLGSLATYPAVQQGTPVDFDKVLERADKLLEEAKAFYEEAREKSAVPSFIEAGFKLEEARIKYVVIQEIGPPDKQKIAGERLRSVNQLSKLIHDGKVAITGTPAKSSDPDPSGSPNKPSPPETPNVAKPPGAPVAILAKRLVVPDATKQKDAEKLVRDLYKEQYSKKSPADRKTLCRLLLEQSTKNREDSAGLWVLYREAQDAAIQACDAKLITTTVDLTASDFDIDGMSMKSSAYTMAAKVAKTPEENAGLAEEFPPVIAELIAADQFDQADKGAGIALQCARKANSPALVSSATVRAKEVAEAKSLFQSFKSVLEVLAKSPDDPAANLEMGKFLCFVKDNWDLGLRFAAKGSDPILKGLAEREMALPQPPAERVAIADVWFDLADKEKSPLRKSRMNSHAAALYAGALSDTTGLVRAKIEKRLAEIRSETSSSKGSLTTGGPSAPIDLLKLVDPKKDAFVGNWDRDGDKIKVIKGSYSRLEIPYEPPEEYDLKVVFQGGNFTEAVALLSKGGKGFGVGLKPGQGHGAIYNSAGNVKLDGLALAPNTPHTLFVQVRSSSLKLQLDGKDIQEWKFDLNTLGPNPGWAPKNPQMLGIGATGDPMVFQSMTVVEISGRGKRFR
jgi:hypothetical protein